VNIEHTRLQQRRESVKLRLLHLVKGHIGGFWVEWVSRVFWSKRLCLLGCLVGNELARGRKYVVPGFFENKGTRFKFCVQNCGSPWAQVVCVYRSLQGVCRRMLVTRKERSRVVVEPQDMHIVCKSNRLQGVCLSWAPSFLATVPPKEKFAEYNRVLMKRSKTFVYLHF
jgi:hypothetical protein